MLSTRTKKTLGTAAVVATALILASCGSDSPPPGGGGGGGQPQYGGTFIFPITSDPATLNPILTTQSTATRVACLTHEGLTRMDAKLEPQPALAESWDVSDDNMTYTFHLRENATWHDGEPFTSADVVWSLENAIMPLGVQSGPALTRYIDSVAAVDEHTVTIALNRPYGPLLGMLGCKSNGAILPKHLYEGTDVASNPHNTSDSVGTGPFKLEEWAAGSHLRLVKNENYWNPGRPYLDGVVFQVIADAQAAIQSLQTGDLDAIGNENSSSTNVAQLVEGSNGDLYQFLEGRVPQADTVMFNTRDGALADPAVRKAIATAIDVDSIIERAYFGLGSPSQSAIAAPEFHNPAVDYSTLYAYDPAKAKQMLAHAGYPDGLTLRLAYTPVRAGSESATQIIRENLGAIGVTVELTPMEHSVFADAVFARNDFDMMYFLLSQQVHPDIGVARFYTCSAITGQPFTNGSGFCDPALDELFVTGATGPSPDARQAAYFEAQVVIADALNQVNLRDAAFPGVAWKHVHNLDLGSDAPYFWDEIWLEQ